MTTVHLLAIALIFLCGDASSSPIKANVELNNGTDTLPHSSEDVIPQRSGSLFVQHSDSDNRRYDDQVATKEPTLSPKTTISLYKLFLIRQIHRLQSELKTPHTQVTPNPKWREENLYATDTELNNMSTAELHDMLMNIKKVMGATLSDLCCPLGR
ncbi:uncharacterized protein LOC124257728 [Haliotis rubra]|uniref:uncharacterized protein LOC124257728 n=1 Tax=Haliotis rubra TaxID=36100 RepID=UPI001EE591D1|nr:uncharacterized protein LOC124257728 [Haliotis rubra]